MGGSIGYAIRVAKGSLGLSHFRIWYPDGPPEHLEARARGIGWSEVHGWPEEVSCDTPPSNIFAYVFDVPQWAVDDIALGHEVLEYVAGRVRISRLRAWWQALRLSRRFGQPMPLLLSAAINLAVDEVDEWVEAAWIGSPARLPSKSFLELTLPAAREARDSGMSVEEFAEYVSVSGGRIPAGAVAAGVPAEYVAVL